jgi:hypothetical protein
VVILQLLSPSALTTMTSLIARVAARRPSHLAQGTPALLAVLVQKVLVCIYMHYIYIYIYVMHIYIHIHILMHAWWRVARRISRKVPCKSTNTDTLNTLNTQCSGNGRCSSRDSPTVSGWCMTAAASTARPQRCWSPRRSLSSISSTATACTWRRRRLGALPQVY